MQTVHRFSATALALAVFTVAAQAGPPSPHAAASQIDAIRSPMAKGDNTRCVVAAADYHRVNPWILRAILSVESGFREMAINRNGNGTVDVGMAQINSIHFRELASHGIAPSQLMDACVATYVAAWHLAKQMRQRGNTWQAIGAYHSSTPCHNQRYAALVWNRLHAWRVVAGERMPVASMAYCQSLQSTARQTAPARSAVAAAMTVVDFD